MAKKYYSHFIYDPTSGLYNLQNSTSHSLILNVPFNIDVHEISHNSVRISWNIIPLAETYRVIVNNIIVAGNITETTYTITDLVANFQQYVQVFAVKDGAVIRQTAMVPVKTLSVDGVQIVGSAEAGNISLRWNSITRASKYCIYVGVPGRVIGVDAGMARNWNLNSEIYPDTSYLIYVLAFNETSILASGAISIKTPSQTPCPPIAERFTIIGITNDTISLRWEATLSTDFYRIYVNNNLVVDNLFDTSAVIPGLLPGVTYSIEVVSVNAYGEARSNLIRATTSSQGNSNLIPPLLVSPNDGFTTIDPTPTLYWQVPKGLDGTRLEFIVEIAEDPNFSKNVRKYNSFVNKEGFSFQSPRDANSDEIVSFVVKDNLIKY